MKQVCYIYDILFSKKMQEKGSQMMDKASNAAQSAVDSMQQV